eukprot:CAMPEP_0182866892 /NCGR_PEP_ID=MMETSP0034_2-20130328/8435_1 /TAXON_ID=156128 /ORGANISM="Nephroselmis pyriformis, Strain CCMP717" /LENGTH=473 /DNA_ID=CAMNT_0024999225 /DNA_START=189 /DNA_END=1607 /DNA_ORIENTATION=-
MVKLDAATEKRMLRQVLREIHPDRFDALHPENSKHNSMSLKVLNSFVDGFSQGRELSSTRVSFWIHGPSGLEMVETVLPANGSLRPLLASFGLIERGMVGDDDYMDADREFIEWMQNTVRDAVDTAEKYERLKSEIGDLSEELCEEYNLNSLETVSEFGGALGVEEQQLQLDALVSLREALQGFGEEQRTTLEGLRIQLYGERGETVRACMVCEDGSINVIAGERMAEEIGVLDLRRAQVLSRLGNFWRQRVEDLTGELNKLLRVEGVVGDYSWTTGDMMGAQRFVLFAGRVLEQREPFEWALRGRTFMYTVLVHGDTAAPYVDYMESTSILQVRSDCPPSKLLEFMMSERGAAVDDAVSASIDARKELEAVMEEVRVTFGARYVISVCPNDVDEEVLAAGNRLIENATRIRAAVNLKGASLCFDTCYDAWENGFISFPYDFVMGELEAKLSGLLAKQPGAGGEDGGEVDGAQ